MLFFFIFTPPPEIGCLLLHPMSNYIMLKNPLSEPEIVLKFVRKTFLTEIKFYFDPVGWLNPKKDNFTLKFLINSPGNYETIPHWNLDYTLAAIIVEFLKKLSGQNFRSF